MASQKVAAGFIIFRILQQDVQYLLLKASYGEKHWTPPKGHVDPGESELDTAYRETQEEAGLVKDQLDVLDSFHKELHYQAFGNPKRTVYWLARLRDPSAPVTLSHEHTEYKWLDLRQAQTFAKYVDMQQVLLEADTTIKEDITG